MDVALSQEEGYVGLTKEQCGGATIDDYDDLMIIAHAFLRYEEGTQF